MTIRVLHTGLISQYILQALHAAEKRQAMHVQLLARGYTWDGMDGYTAPDVKSGPLTGDELKSILGDDE